jgi:hypothetical protein
VALIWLAAVQSSGRGPTSQEAAQLLAYSLLLYSVPLCAVWWQQYKDGESTAIRAGGLLARSHDSKDDLTLGSKAASNQVPRCTAATKPSAKQGDVGRRTGEQKQGGQAAAQQQHAQGTPVPPLQQEQVVPKPAVLALSVADLVAAGRSRGSALYTSSLQHSRVSLKVSWGCRGTGS